MLRLRDSLACNLLWVSRERQESHWREVSFCELRHSAAKPTHRGLSLLLSYGRGLVPINPRNDRHTTENRGCATTKDGLGLWRESSLV